MDEIKYYLKTLNFMNDKILTDEILNKLLEQMIYNQMAFSRETIISRNQELDIALCPNKLIKIARIRENVNDYNIYGSVIESINKKKKFKFDHVFNSENNKQIYYEILSFLSTRIQFKKDMCFVFNGYSGSGKSYTMFGDNNNGLFNYIINYLRDEKYDIKALIYEIYNNEVYLINGNNKIKNEGNLYKIDNYISIDNETINDTICNFRATSVNNVHNKSSRSHLIVELKIYKNDIFINKVSFFDLCGNEKYSKSTDKNNKIMIDETLYINKSLFNMYEYIKAFQKGKKFNANKCALTNALKNYGNIIFSVLIGITKCGNDAFNLLNNISSILN